MTNFQNNRGTVPDHHVAQTYNDPIPSNHSTVCPRCGGRLESDDIALYRKLRDRTANASDCCCRYCLAAHFRCSPALMDEKIRQFKESGCTLFAAISQEAL